MYPHKFRVPIQPQLDGYLPPNHIHLVFGTPPADELANVIRGERFALGLGQGLADQAHEGRLILRDLASAAFGALLGDLALAEFLWIVENLWDLAPGRSSNPPHLWRVKDSHVPREVTLQGGLKLALVAPVGKPRLPQIR